MGIRNVFLLCPFILIFLLLMANHYDSCVLLIIPLRQHMHLLLIKKKKKHMHLLKLHLKSIDAFLSSSYFSCIYSITLPDRCICICYSKRTNAIICNSMFYDLTVPHLTSISTPLSQLKSFFTTHPP